MFTNMSYLISHNAPQLSYGAAVTDIDGDGEFEIFVAGYGQPSQILKWTEQGFINVASGILSNAGRQAISVAAADIDGDGREEIYVLNTDTFGGRKRFGDRLFKWYRGRWIDLFALPENQHVQNLFAGRSVGVVDRLGDGRYGFFVANYGGPMRLFELIRDSLELIDAAPEFDLNRVTGGRAVLPAPLISPRMDIFLNNENGPNFLFRNEGDGTFTECAEDAGIHDPFEHGRGVATLDVDGDGLLDLVYGNWDGPHRMYLQSQRHNFTNVAPPDLAHPSAVRTVLAADFDNDGNDEIFFNNIMEANRIFGWRDHQWQRLAIGDALEPEGAGTGAITGAFDGSGHLQLLITHGESIPQPLSLYTAPNDNNWLRVLPLTRYGAPARGALVRLYTEDHVQTRVICAGSGYLCQMEPVAHFGLGRSSAVERIEIQWTDGEMQILTQPPGVNMQIVVRHD
ncbi:MAG: CRTAC1 family protein [Anaerolineae bacterium]|nr:CRTAC1 family protein [Anaerolineae bacterium]